MLFQLSTRVRGLLPLLMAALIVSAVGGTPMTAGAAPPTRYASGAFFIQHDSGAFQLLGAESPLLMGADGAMTLTITEQADAQGPRDAARPELRSTSAEIRFVGARNVRPQPFTSLDTSVSILQGSNASAWRTRLPAWGGVRYPSIYPGIDLVLEGTEAGMRQRLVAHPGADVSKVRLEVVGATPAAVTKSQLQLDTPLGQRALPLFEIVDAAGKPLKGTAAPSIEGQQISSPIASAAEAPAEQMLYRTLIASAGYDNAYDQAVDSAGNSYIVGETNAATMPYPSQQVGTVADFSALVAKHGPNGELLYLTLIGGSSGERANSISLIGDVAVIGGTTRSTDFPVTRLDTTPGGGTCTGGCRDGFVLWLNATGTGLLASTYLGGVGSDDVLSVAATSAGVVYAAGITWASNFPVTADALDTTYNGLGDAFAVKINPLAANISWSTFYGSSHYDDAYAIAVDTNGIVTISGATEGQTPTTSNAFDKTFNGTMDSYVIKLNATGRTLLHGTLIGGGAVDGVFTMAQDAAGNVYIAGETTSADYPISAGAYDTTHNGSRDSFVTKFDATLSTAQFSTLLGGADIDNVVALALGADGAVYAAGYTYSSNYPALPSGWDSTYNGKADGTLAVLAPDGRALRYATFYGGEGEEKFFTIALDQLSRVYLAGYNDVDIMLLKMQLP